MAFTIEGAKTTLLLIRRPGGLSLAGMVRNVTRDGDTYIQPINGVNLTGITFDDIDFIDPPSSNTDGDTNLTFFSGDFNLWEA